MRNEGVAIINSVNIKVFGEKATQVHIETKSKGKRHFKYTIDVGILQIIKTYYIRRS